MVRENRRTLNDRFWIKSADGDTRQERRKEEEVTRANDDLIGEMRRPMSLVQEGGTYDVVFRVVDVLEEAGRAPATTEDHDILLLGVVGELFTWMAVFLGNVVENAGGGDGGDEGNATEVLEESAPF